MKIFTSVATHEAIESSVIFKVSDHVELEALSVHGRDSGQIRDGTGDAKLRAHGQE